MKLIYTHESLLMVNHVKNLMAQAGIDTVIKNEFSQGALGDIAVFDCWPQLWLTQEGKWQQAQGVIAALSQIAAQPDWICGHCGETNDASFELCWQCGQLLSEQ
ncbi:DUF2007 domain-containing protein [Motilimonas eburnea]|uniref:putative signal transducing protein n=1 Tax=Motilimonas eburnea TaxID=1737488 RepID=UPI001E5F9767|nr:DUF2007 domain-containing protein [Motilimonas eburnea]MCE2572580.1 DUF2007 domain-containing protein [Motilimonas eburnea]